MESVLLGRNEFEGLVTNNVNWAIVRLHQQPGLGEAIAKEDQDHQEPGVPWMEPVAHMLLLDDIGDSGSWRGEDCVGWSGGFYSVCGSFA